MRDLSPCGSPDPLPRSRSAVRARPTRLPSAYDAVLGAYAAALECAPLSAETRRTYRSRVRMFLAWPADHAAGGIIAEIAQTAGLDDPTTAHVLRHTLATTLVRGRTDMVLVAEIFGHARLETTRRYSLPSDKDKEDALKLITVDR
ncbi:tyrosine-type recombinase/integrase [Streptosporangium roseum]|uniref:tyrosine-type recombinase/integrase n=1 Tax=Streptosporangium roseum TaxID=2001 RepID=UPI00331A89F5